MDDSTTTTEALHNEAERSTREALGYVGYCHLGTARVWSSTYEGCNTEAVEFIAANPRYMTRKGLFIYKLILGEEKKFIKRLHNVDNT
jgi:GTP-dependent phosphoenolpyruvate carboxykinase